MDQQGSQPRKNKSEGFIIQQGKLLHLNLSTTKVHNPTPQLNTITNFLQCPYTMLKESSTFSSTDCVCLSDDSVKRQCPLSEQYLKRLQEAEQSVSNRDILISMLQQQLNKLEEMYKKQLDEHQEVRYKYCSVTQEFSNFKKICEKVILFSFKNGICLVLIKFLVTTRKQSSHMQMY